MNISVERQKRFDKNPVPSVENVSFKKLLKMIQDCHHPMDARTLKQIHDGEPGYYFVTDSEYEYRISIEK